MTECWVFDLDKTLADNRWRDSLVPKKGFRTIHFARYNKACIKDKPIKSTVDLLKSLHSSGFKIVLVTGRGIEAKQETEKWLLSNHIPFDALHMRKQDDNRDAFSVKAELFEEVSSEYFILGAFDDDPSLVSGLARLGYNMIMVGINQTCRRRSASQKRK
nr:HAD family acid phosphatase [uncultured Vibrio sp.]